MYYNLMNWKDLRFVGLAPQSDVLIAGSIKAEVVIIIRKTGILREKENNPGEKKNFSKTDFNKLDLKFANNSKNLSELSILLG